MIKKVEEVLKIDRNGVEMRTFGIGSVNSYQKESLVGEGSYGQVWSALNRMTGQRVALKKLRLEPLKNNTGFRLSYIREIKLLKLCKHNNIVNLIDIVTSTKETQEGLHRPLYLVFEYIENDLSGFIQAKYKFSFEIIKSLSKQLFIALEYLHDLKICHRDIKSSNLLITNKFVLKIADFGFARKFDSISGDEKTTRVVTIWYRAPELLLNFTQYNFSIDIWAAALIVLEMFIGRAVFQAKDEFHLFSKIVNTIGFPDEDSWALVGKLLDSTNFDKPKLKMFEHKSSTLEKFLEENEIPEEIKFLVQAILVYNPNNRPSAKECLEFDVFKNFKCSDVELPKLDIEFGLHEYECKRRIRENGFAGFGSDDSKNSLLVDLDDEDKVKEKSIDTKKKYIEQDKEQNGKEAKEAKTLDKINGSKEKNRSYKQSKKEIPETRRKYRKREKKIEHHCREDKKRKQYDSHRNRSYDKYSKRTRTKNPRRRDDYIRSGDKKKYEEKTSRRYRYNSRSRSPSRRRKRRSRSRSRSRTRKHAKSPRRREGYIRSGDKKRYEEKTSRRYRYNSRSRSRSPPRRRKRRSRSYSRARNRRR